MQKFLEFLAYTLSRKKSKCEFLKKTKGGSPWNFSWGNFFFKKLQNFIEMLRHPKKVSTINFGPIRPLHAALRIGKITKNPKNTLSASILSSKGNYGRGVQPRDLAYIIGNTHAECLCRKNIFYKSQLHLQIRAEMLFFPKNPNIFADPVLKPDF